MINDLLIWCATRHKSTFRCGVRFNFSFVEATEVLKQTEFGAGD